MRAKGFQGFSCNLRLIGQVKGEGANWQTTEWREGKGSNRKVCAYHGTAHPTFASTTTIPRTNFGVRTIDISNPTNCARVGRYNTIGYAGGNGFLFFIMQSVVGQETGQCTRMVDVAVEAVAGDDGGRGGDGGLQWERLAVGRRHRDGDWEHEHR